MTAHNVPDAAWVSFGARVVLAVVFAWAGLAKAFDRAASLRAVRGYQLLGDGPDRVVAYALPWLEIGLAIFLLVGLARRAAGIVAALLLVAFIAGVTSAWIRGLRIDCGCFGGGGYVAHPTYLLEVLRDVGLLALAFIVIIPRHSRFSLDTLLEVTP